MARAVAPRVTKVPEIRTGDTVLVLAGKDAGKRGEVKRVERPSLVGQPFRVVVDGLNLAKRHTKPRPRMNQNDRTPRMQQGGIVDKPMPVPIGRVMLVCPRCDRPTRDPPPGAGDRRPRPGVRPLRPDRGGEGA